MSDGIYRNGCCPRCSIRDRLGRNGLSLVDIDMLATSMSSCCLYLLLISDLRIIVTGIMLCRSRRVVIIRALVCNIIFRVRQMLLRDIWMLLFLLFMFFLLSRFLYFVPFCYCTGCNFVNYSFQIIIFLNYIN